jgi:hypothetical protein
VPHGAVLSLAHSLAHRPLRVPVVPAQLRCGRRGGRARPATAPLRRALYLAAHSAQRHDPELAAYLQRKRAAGKAYRAAVVALARKLLARVYAVLAQGRPYTVQPPAEVSHAPSADLDIS